MLPRPQRLAAALAAPLTAAVLCTAPSSADELTTAAPPPPPPGEAARWLASIAPSPPLQDLLDRSVAQLRRGDTALGRQQIRAALIDLPGDGAEAGFAHWNGESPVYPASVVKFVYLMAAFAWQERDRLDIDPGLDRSLREMIRHSSNRATQRVVWRLTATEPGPRLEPAAYAGFRERRHAVKRWLQSLGIEGLHAVHPTYDGNGDLYGRDRQFLEDAEVPGSLPQTDGDFRNRQAMTALDTARLLALLATDRALTPESSAEVRERMRRDPAQQPYLWHRIAGGAAGIAGAEVFSKTGTWGPIFADAGIVRAASGRQLALAVFLEGRPAYRGDFIAKLTARLAEATLGGARGPRSEARRSGAPRGRAYWTQLRK